MFSVTASEGGDLKVGGWEQIPLEKKDSYSEGLQFLLKEAKELSSGYELVAVQRQVVAGFNYRYTVKCAELGLVEAVVYKDLDGGFDLIDIRPVKSETKDL
jgi:hypothetical protein